MPLPGNLTPITVTATYLNPDGSAAAGTVEFLLTAPASDPGGPALFPQTKITATLDGAGHISVVLPATDDPDWAQRNLTYRVGESITGIPTRYWYTQVPAASPGGTMDLASVAPAVPQQPVVSYLPAAGLGTAGGPASLDGSGHVPSAQLGYSAYQAMASYNAAAASGAPALQVRQEPGGIARMHGNVVFSGVINAGVALFTLPLNYRPANTTTITVRTRIAGVAGQFVTINTNGDVTTSAATVATQVIDFDGVTFDRA